MIETLPTTKERVISAHQAHPDWTAKRIATHLGIAVHHVYNNARTAGLTLARAPLPGPHAPVGAGAQGVDAVAAEAVSVAPLTALDITVFATKPHEMADAQRSMIGWIDQKIALVQAEQQDAERGLQIACDHGWRHDTLVNVVRRIRKRLSFYEKVKAALEAGYYIVPPFPLDIFTIRTDRRTPDAKRTTMQWGRRHDQSPRLLPAGEGRYVNAQPTVYQRTYPAADTGKKEDTIEYFAKDFREVNFPFALAKPEVMEATAAAMALKVFDQLGVLPRSMAFADPIVCGQILKPDESKTPVTFFIAWWLDTRTL